MHYKAVIKYLRHIEHAHLRADMKHLTRDNICITKQIWNIPETWSMHITEQIWSFWEVWSICITKQIWHVRDSWNICVKKTDIKHLRHIKHLHYRADMKYLKKHEAYSLQSRHTKMRHMKHMLYKTDMKYLSIMKHMLYKAEMRYFRHMDSMLYKTYMKYLSIISISRFELLEAHEAYAL